jgi:uncharacterized membrane protein YebE (DUF533 family)
MRAALDVARTAKWFIGSVQRSHEMVDTKELLGALLQRGMTDSSQRRIENSLSEESLGGILEREFGASPARAPAAAPTRVPSGAQLRPQAPTQQRSTNRPFDDEEEIDAPRKPAPSGGLGSMFGGSLKGALGAGALALLGAIAMKALRGGSPQGSQKLDSAANLVGGPREPSIAEQQQQDQSLANLIVKAMLNAAKADGHIDEDELQKVVGELQGDGITQAEREFVLEEVRKPMSTAEIVRAVPNRQVGAQVYAASLLAIEIDTPAEKAYIQQLARDLGLDSQAVNQIHETLGIA